MPYTGPSRAEILELCINYNDNHPKEDGHFRLDGASSEEISEAALSVMFDNDRKKHYTKLQNVISLSIKDLTKIQKVEMQKTNQYILMEPHFSEAMTRLKELHKNLTETRASLEDQTQRSMFKRAKPWRLHLQEVLGEPGTKTPDSRLVPAKSILKEVRFRRESGKKSVTWGKDVVAGPHALLEEGLPAEEQRKKHRSWDSPFDVSIVTKSRKGYEAEARGDDNAWEAENVDLALEPIVKSISKNRTSQVLEDTDSEAEKPDGTKNRMRKHRKMGRKADIEALKLSADEAWKIHRSANQANPKAPVMHFVGTSMKEGGSEEKKRKDNHMLQHKIERKEEEREKRRKEKMAKHIKIKLETNISST